MVARDVDLFVIGGGSGGVRAARIAAGYGARVMLAEEYRLGGTCVIRGCVPKKLMVYASRFADEFEDAVRYGWTSGEARFDWSVLKTNRDAEIARLERVYRSLLDGSKVEIADERAVIEDAHTVRLVRSGRRVSAEHILIAVGAAPSAEPAIPGGELGITSNDVFELERQPESVLVVGGGYIAVEFAGIFAGLGTKTTQLHRGDKLLRGFDEDLRDALGEVYRKRGIALALGMTLRSLEQDDGGVAATLSSGEVRRFDRVLVATGRRPNTAGLGLERVGIEPAPGGAISVDAYSQTSVPSIWAVGDVTDRANLTPVAIREGHAFADTVFGGKRSFVDHDLIPTAVFSTPEIGTVGLSEEKARQRHGEDVVVYRSSFRPMKATISGRDERMLMKLLVDGKSDRVLGVHVLGHDAGEIIQMAGIALAMGATKADFDRTIAVHPTAAEELVTMRTPVAARAAPGGGRRTTAASVGSATSHAPPHRGPARHKLDVGFQRQRGHVGDRVADELGIHHGFGLDRTVRLRDARLHAPAHGGVRIADVDLPAGDVVGASVERGRLREARHGVLGRRVGDRERPRGMGRDRAVVDDAAAARRLVLHDPEGVLRADEERREVRGDDLPEGLRRQLLDRHARSAAPGIVEEQVEPSVGLDRLLEEVRDAGVVADVGRHAQHAALLGHRRDLVQRFRAASREHDVPAVPHQGQGGRLADPRSRSRHDRDLARHLRCPPGAPP